MTLTVLSFVYIFVFIVHGLRALTTNEYDWDIDQFMYSGSRLINGELAWTKEFDDKSPVIQYLFSIPAAFKSTGMWVSMTVIVTLIAVRLTYLLLVELVQSYSVKIDRKDAGSISFFCISFYLALLVCIFGSIIHINAICSSLTLITICLLYNDQSKMNVKNKSIEFILSSICASIAISLRPYMLVPILLIPAWSALRANKNIQREKIGSATNILSIIRYSVIWILITCIIIFIINVIPYILTNNINSFLSTIKLNSVDYIQDNTFHRQYINIGKNPILYPIIIVFCALPWLRLNINKIIKNRYYISNKKTTTNILNLDIDLVFFSLISPILLEESFIRRHFFAHYFNLFSPYICISLCLFIVLIKINEQENTRKLIHMKLRNQLVSILLIVCLLTDKSITSSISHIVKGDGKDKISNLEQIKSLVVNESSKNNTSFLFPEDNYYHWKLSESRHGFPQAAVFKNIRLGQFDKVLEENKELKINYLLPNQKELCNVLAQKGPDLIFTKPNSYTFKCLKRKQKYYNLWSPDDRDKQISLIVFAKILGSN